MIKGLFFPASALTASFTDQTPYFRVFLSKYDGHEVFSAHFIDSGVLRPMLRIEIL